MRQSGGRRLHEQGPAVYTTGMVCEVCAEGADFLVKALLPLFVDTIDSDYRRLNTMQHAMPVVSCIDCAVRLPGTEVRGELILDGE